MKIILLTSNLAHIGGIQHYNKTLLAVFRELGHDVRLVELSSDSLVSKLKFLMRAFFEAIRFRSDIIFCGHINFSPICYFLKLFLRREYIVETYGIEVWEVNKKILRKGLEGARKITSVARYTKKKIIFQFPQLEDKISVIPNVVDGDKFYSKDKSKLLLERHGIAVSSKIILTLGRLSASEGYKGYDKVIQALPEIVKEVPEARYVLVGDGDDAPRVRGIIKEKRMESYVAMAGRVPKEELVDYYNLADVFVMPSKGEGFATVFLEALACGKPVIAGNCDGSVDPLMDGELGILVDPDSMEEIGRAVINILNKKVASNIVDGNLLRKKALENFGIEKFKSRVDSLLSL